MTWQAANAGSLRFEIALLNPCSTADLAIDSSVVSTSLSQASGLTVTALNSSTSSLGGAQLTDYTLTTAAVDTNSAALSGTSKRHGC